MENVANGGIDLNWTNVLIRIGQGTVAEVLAREENRLVFNLERSDTDSSQMHDADIMPALPIRRHVPNDIKVHQIEIKIGDFGLGSSLNCRN